MKSHVRAIEVYGETMYILVEGYDVVEILEQEEFIKQVLEGNVIDAHFEGLRVEIQDELPERNLKNKQIRDLYNVRNTYINILDALEAWGYEDTRLYNLETSHSILREMLSLLRELSKQWEHSKMWHAAKLKDYLSDDDIASAPKYNICCMIEFYKHQSEDVSDPELTLWIGTTQNNSLVIAGQLPDKEEPEWVLGGNGKSPFNNLINKIKETLGYRTV